MQLDASTIRIKIKYTNITIGDLAVGITVGCAEGAAEGNGEGLKSANIQYININNDITLARINSIEHKYLLTYRLV